MTLAQIITTIKAVAMAQPTVNMTVDNDVFKLNALPDAKYGVFAFVQGNHDTSIESNIVTYRFTFYYVDRLTENGSNEIEVQSVGMSTLGNILRTLHESDIFEVRFWQTTTFTQKFNDMCAGVFSNVIIEAPVDYTCADNFEI